MYKTRTQTFNKTTITSYFAESSEKLSEYKSNGGWKTLENWMSLANKENIKNYYEILKKYSLLREYQRNGYGIDKLVNHPKFEQLTASEVYRLIRSKADRIHTVILTNEEAEVLNSNIKNVLIQCMMKPDLGIPFPFPIINDIFRGMKRPSVMAVGMLSNAGKSRFMTLLIAYIALVLHEKVFVMVNEMTIDELRYALITTVINNQEFQEVYGINLNKKEKELTLGLYKDKNGNLIYQKTDEWGEPTETIEEYIQRVSENSEEYNKIMKIAEWIEAETSELILTKDVSGGYDDNTLEFELRKASVTYGIHYFFYDTFKQDVSDTGDWAAMKATATKLTELAKELDMFGYLSIQLTDDVNYIKPDELTSSNIANCKAVKHVLHTLVLFKEIPKCDFYKFGYIQSDKEWGNDVVCELKPERRYYVGNVDKNRFGRKVKLIFEVDLDLNIWKECGELVRK